MVKYMTVDDTSTSMKIDAQVTEEEVDSLGIVTTDRVDPFNVLHVIKRDINMQTVHIKTELISNSVLTVG